MACSFFLATSIMGVEEAPSAPPAPIAPSMGVEEVAATPLEEIMVCVIGVEEPPLASVGENIDASAPRRDEDSGFCSWLRTNSVGRWRNISGKWFLIGLVFVAIALALAIGLILGTLATQSTPATEVDNPCIICPNGITAGDDFVPNAFSGNSMTCLELINSSMDFESGSQMCSFSSIYKISCCPMTTAPTSADNVIVAAPTNTPTETPTFAPTELPTFDAMTPAPIPAPVTLDNGTGVGNTCIICPDGTDAAAFAPYADDGDSRTCTVLIDEARMYKIGSDDCGYSELHELHCCYTAPENPCIICPDGATAGDDYVPEDAGNSVGRATCKEFIDGAKRFESESDVCGFYEIDVAY